MTNFRIFDSYPTVYYLPHFDNFFKKNHVQNQIWPYSNSFLNRKELEKHFYTKKLRIFHSFPKPYHLRQSDKPFAKNSEKTFPQNFTVFQITFKSYRIWKNSRYMEDADFNKLSNAISFAQFWQTVWKLSPKYDSRFLYEGKTVSKTALKPLTFYQKSY